MQSIEVFTDRWKPGWYRGSILVPDMDELFYLRREFGG